MGTRSPYDCCQNALNFANEMKCMQFSTNFSKQLDWSNADASHHNVRPEINFI